MINIDLRLPQGFTMRASTLDDIAAITDLIKLVEITFRGTAETTLDTVRTTWREPGVDPATDTQVVMAPEGKLVAYILVGHSNHARIGIDGDVHPDYRCRGIGTQLMCWAEARARQHIQEAAPGVRVSLNTATSSLNTSAIRLFEQHGFELVRQMWRMSIDLHETPLAPQWAEGITLRTYTPDMAYAAFEADEEAFKDHWGNVPGDFDEWAHWTINAEGFDPTLWFLAMDGDQIAGYSFCSYEEETGGWVDHLGVRRPWRRKGLGMALLYQAFSEFYRRGIHHVSLGVDAKSLTGATRLYERAGMRVIRQQNNYEKELRAGKELSTQSVDV